MTKPKLKSEDPPRCAANWIKLLSFESFDYQHINQHPVLHVLASIDVSFHHVTGVAHLERQHGSPSGKLNEVRMHLVQAVAVQKAHQSHQILALDSSKLASVPWSSYAQVFSEVYNSETVENSDMNDDMM